LQTALQGNPAKNAPARRIIQAPVVDLKDAHDNIFKKIRRLFSQKPNFPLKVVFKHSSQ